MATKTWIGDDTGNEGLWATAANWSGASVPVSGDDLMFDGNANYAVESSPAGAADDFDSITITSDFAYDFGTSGAHIIFSGAADNGADLLSIDASSCPTYCKITGLFPDTTILGSGTAATSCVISGTFTLLNLIKGTVTVVTGSTITTMNMLYSSTQASDSNITIPTGCTVTNIFQRGGVATCGSAIATRLDLDAGTFTHTDGNTGTLNQRGGTYYWNAEGHTITQVNLFGGTLDCRDNGSAKTITNMDMWPSSVAYFNNGGQNIVLTNPANYYGGTIVPDKASAFQINQ